MTREETPKLPEWALTEPEDGPLPVERVTPHDLPLHMLTKILHGAHGDSDGEFGLTITSRGAVVSGLAISAAKWGNLLAQSLIDSGQDALGEAMGTFLATNRSRQRSVALARVDRDLSEIVPGYLHFRSVTVFQGNQSLKLPLWRAQLESVDGWSLGVISDDSAQKIEDLKYEKFLPSSARTD